MNKAFDEWIGAPHHAVVMGTPDLQSRPGIVDLRIQTVSLLIVSTVVVAGSLYWLQSVMIPFVLALFLALGLAPVVDGLMRWLRLPKALALFLALVLSMGILLLAVAVMSNAVTQLALNASAYQARLMALLDWAAHTLPLEHLGITEEEIMKPLSRLPMGTVSGILLGTTNAIFDLTSQALLVTLFLVYLLVGFSGRGEMPRGIWGEMETRVKRFILTKTLISAVTGFLVGLSLEVMGVPLALVFGLFAFALNFIPAIGSVVSTLLPIPVVLMNPEISLTVSILAIVIPGTIHFSIGNIVEPVVIGDSLELNPVAVLLSLMIWGAIWGVIGMLLATPITAVLKILCDQTETTRPLGHLLGRSPGVPDPGVSET